jgi:dethiobiotin synthetase
VRAVLVAGSGTDVGKTYVTASLVRTMRAQGRRVRVCKPLASGLAPLHDPAFAQSDPALLLAAAGLPLEQPSLDGCSPWRFAAPLSPDMAAAAEGRRVRLVEVVEWTRAVLAEPGHDHVLVEGVGGVMSPVTEDATGLDLAAALGLPVALVCGSYLGAISHALTALEALRAHGLDTSLLIVNESGEGSPPFDQTCEVLARFAGPVRLAQLHRGGAAPADWLAGPT